MRDIFDRRIIFGPIKAQFFSQFKKTSFNTRHIYYPNYAIILILRRTNKRDDINFSHSFSKMFPENIQLVVTNWRWNPNVVLTRERKGEGKLFLERKSKPLGRDSGRPSWFTLTRDDLLILIYGRWWSGNIPIGYGESRNFSGHQMSWAMWKSRFPPRVYARSYRRLSCRRRSTCAYIYVPFMRRARLLRMQMPKVEYRDGLRITTSLTAASHEDERLSFLNRLLHRGNNTLNRNESRSKMASHSTGKYELVHYPAIYWNGCRVYVALAER